MTSSSQQPDAESPGGAADVGVDALFALTCGCVLDGCSDSEPGRKWAAGVRNGILYCTASVGGHGPQRLVDVVALNEPVALPSRPDDGGEPTVSLSAFLPVPCPPGPYDVTVRLLNGTTHTLDLVAAYRYHDEGGQPILIVDPATRNMIHGGVTAGGAASVLVTRPPEGDGPAWLWRAVGSDLYRHGVMWTDDLNRLLGSTPRGTFHHINKRCARLSDLELGSYNGGRFTEQGTIR